LAVAIPAAPFAAESWLLRSPFALSTSAEDLSTGFMVDVLLAAWASAQRYGVSDINEKMPINTAFFIGIT
jgi:hypothetical protein